jgi:hypothetical protein
MNHGPKTHESTSTLLSLGYEFDRVTLGNPPLKVIRAPFKSMYSPAQTTQNSHIRIFVSSTFFDMMEECDELMAFARLELCWYYRGYMVVLTGVMP